MQLTSATARVGKFLYAIGLAGLGVLSLKYRDFAMSWQPVPETIPAHAVLACVSGAILLLGGAAIFVKRFARPAVLVLAIFTSLWLIFLQLPKAIVAPFNLGSWLGFAENLLLICGGWVLYLRTRAAADGDSGRGANSHRTVVRVLQILYGISLLLIGPSHFVFKAITASMVPAWLPFHSGFAILTGVGHLAAGAAILLAIIPGIAALLEAAMITCFVVLLHLPSAIADPTSRLQWTMLCIATAYAGAAWLMASTFAPRKDA